MARTVTSEELFGTAPKTITSEELFAKEKPTVKQTLTTEELLPKEPAEEPRGLQKLPFWASLTAPSPEEQEKSKEIMRGIREFKPGEVTPLQAEAKLWEEKVKPVARKAGEIFPETSVARYLTEDIATGLSELLKPSVITTGMGLRQALTGVGVKIASMPATRKVLEKQFPTFARKLLQQTGLVPQHPLQAIAQKQIQQARAAMPPSAVDKVTAALKQAGPVRATQEALYTAERAKRVGRVVEAGKKVAGERGFFEQLKQLKGELPKVQFEGIRSKVSQLDIDELFNTVELNQSLLPYEKITAKTGLAKLLGVEGGVVPTKGEIGLLRQIFPPDFIKTVLSKRPLMEKVGEGIAEVLNIPRAIMASFDMSAPMRQGVFLVGKPKRFGSAFGNMFKYFFSEKSYQGLMTNIKGRPTYGLMKKGKLPLTEIGAQLTGREEAFMSQFAEKIPLVGKVVKASNRAYTGFLNKLRADVFDDLVATAQKQNIPVGGKLLSDMGSFVGAATGRGKLGVLERAAVALNSVFFSPRLMASRLSLLNPVFYTRLDPLVRKEALKFLFTFAGTAGTVFGLAKLGGADIGADPRSADFGKIKVDNTRFDILGGFQQYLRAAGQLISGEHISSTTGVKTTMGEGYKPLTRLDIITRFIETKEAPVLSFATSLLKGRTAIGKELDVPKEIGLRFTPMVIQDMYDLYQERGLKDLGMVTPAIFGVGVQTYSPDANEMVYSANSVLTHSKKLSKEGRYKEAGDLIERNKKIILTGIELEPFQKQINEYKKQRDFIENNILFTPQQREESTASYNKKIEEIQAKMVERFNQLK